MNPKLAFAVRADYDGRWASQVIGDAQKVATSVKSSGAAVGNSMKAANLNTAGLAAQFNDIGVTLASGQSPLLIALQQGTQISQTLGPMGAGAAVKALGSAFLSLLSPLNLITIGAVAVGAAAVQWLMGINKEEPKAEDSFKAHSEWLQKLLTGYGDLQDAAKKYGESAQQLPQGVVASDVRSDAAVTAEKIAEKAGEAVAAQEKLNTLTRMWIDLRAQGSLQFPDDKDRAQRFDQLINQASEFDSLRVSASSTNKELERVMEVTRELMKTAEEPAIVTMAERTYDLANSIRTLRAQAAAAASTISSLAAAAAGFPSIGKDFGSALGDLKGLGNKPLSDREQANAARINGMAEAQDTVTRTAVLNAYNAAIARIGTREAEEEALKRNKEFQSDADRQEKAYTSVMESLQLQTEALGLNSREQEKLNQIKAAGVDADSAQAQSIRDAVDALYDQKDAIAAVAEEQKKTKAIIDDLQMMTTSFLSQVRSGLMQGKSAWEAFGQAGLNVLDSLAEKMLNAAISNLFTMLFGGATGSLLGPTGSALGGFGSYGKFANGGDFTVGGSGGTDSQMVSFMATPGESVSIRTPGQRGGGGSMITNSFQIDARGAEIGVEQKIMQAIKAAVPEMIRSQAPVAVANAQRGRLA